MIAVWRLLGVLLLLVPFLPLARWFPGMRGTSALLSPFDWLLGVFVVLALAWLLALGARSRTDGSERWSWPAVTLASWIPAALLALLAGVLLIVSWEVFRHRPLLVDSIAQFFQAKILAGGAAVVPRPPEGGFFAIQHLVEGALGWYSQYSPGHPFLLSIGVSIGSAWVVPILLSLGTGVALFLFSREVYGRRAAVLTLALLVLSPFFWFMGASFMNHVSALFFVSVALYLLARWHNRGATACLIGAAMCLGTVFLIRPLDAVAVGLVVGGWAAWRCLNSARPIRLAWAGLGGAAVASLYFAWNAATTGDPLVPGYIELWGAAHGLGFHASPWGEAHTPLTGLRNQLTDLALLNVFLFEWPVPALLPVALFFVLGWDEGPWDRLLLTAAIAVPTAYFFYWHRDAYLGPRFLYVSVAFLIPLTARSILAGVDRFRGRAWGTGGLRVDAAVFTMAALGLCIVYATAYGIPERFRIYAGSMASMKVDLAEEARSAQIDQGLIFVAVSWGNRLISGLRALGVPAADVEQSYRRVDHCELHHLIVAAREGRWAPDRVIDELRDLNAAAEHPVSLLPIDLNGDPTLRLRQDRPLSPDCYEEIRYDQAGYTNYTAHLLVNHPTLDGPLVVARDLREENARLREHYPDRPAFLWRGKGFEPLH